MEKDMNIACTQMHPATLLAIITELILLGAQGALYLSRTHDKTRLWYLRLLVLMLLLNTANGLFPDSRYAIPIHIQHIIVNGIGFSVASYYPLYFHKAFRLYRLRFHAIYGGPLFLMLPYLVFFVIAYSIHGDIDFTRRYGFIDPTIYSLVLLVSMAGSIRHAYRENPDTRLFIEELAAYAAMVPWSAMPMVVYNGWGQLTETLFANLGFLTVSVLMLCHSIRLGRAEQKLIADLELVPIHPESIERNGRHFGLSGRETEIVYLVCERLSYREIGEKLFISELTVKKHVQNIFGKVLVNSRSELARKMNDL
ncbi:helix-turn-helix transcriptional regulator [Parapedobacter deserti]